ncbi:MAG: hypothetical protein K0S61_4225 [Anaerocolumna sp.]|jgi:hypothetical protein|nr:hypothetical protein [Anaerocolumna sp.]
MKIIPHDNICVNKGLTKGKEYDVVEWDDDSGCTPDEYFAVINDEGKKVWIDDWDCKQIPFNRQL